MLNFDQQCSHVDAALESKRGDAKKITDNAEGVMNTLKPCLATVRKFIKEAQVHIGSTE